MEKFSTRRVGVAFAWLLLIAVLSGCAVVNGTANSVAFAKMPTSGTFAMQQAAGDQIVGQKIGRMVAHLVSKHGLRTTDQRPDVLVTFGFDVVPAGSVSMATTMVSQGPRTAYVSGDTVRSRPSTATAMTFIDTTALYDKTVIVLFSNAVTGEKIWQGIVSERGTCRHLFVTSPQILAMMFERFPGEASNLKRTLTMTDEGPKELQRLFPPDTEWGRC